MLSEITGKYTSDPVVFPVTLQVPQQFLALPYCKQLLHGFRNKCVRLTKDKYDI